MLVILICLIDCPCFMTNSHSRSPVCLWDAVQHAGPSLWALRGPCHTSSPPLLWGRQPVRQRGEFPKLIFLLFINHWNHCSLVLGFSGYAYNSCIIIVELHTSVLDNTPIDCISFLLGSVKLVLLARVNYSNTKHSEKNTRTLSTKF